MSPMQNADAEPPDLPGWWDALSDADRKDFLAADFDCKNLDQRHYLSIARTFGLHTGAAWQEPEGPSHLPYRVLLFIERQRTLSGKPPVRRL